MTKIQLVPPGSIVTIKAKDEKLAKQFTDKGYTVIIVTTNMARQDVQRENAIKVQQAVKTQQENNCCVIS